MSIPDNSTIQKLRGQIYSWQWRAAMAYDMNNDELSKQALHYRWEYQKKLAELEGTEPPESPQEPEDFFRGWPRGNPRGRDPDQPARVPRRLFRMRAQAKWHCLFQSNLAKTKRSLHIETFAGVLATEFIRAALYFFRCG